MPDAGTVDVRWLHRDGRSLPGDASLIVEALDGVDVPAGTKHAYVVAEAGVVRRVRTALVADGLDESQISAKAYLLAPACPTRSTESRLVRSEAEGPRTLVRGRRGALSGRCAA